MNHIITPFIEDKFIQIIVYTLLSAVMSAILYPGYIRLLRYFKAGKTIRDDAVTGEKASIFKSLHQHKGGTPTMGGGLLLIVMGVLVGLSYVFQARGYITNSLVTPQETYILLFALFSMGLIGLIDDILNILNFQGQKGLPAKFKLGGMIIFAAFVSYRFHFKLGINDINLRPVIIGTIELPRLLMMFEGQNIGIVYLIITFLMTLTITNAINITDGLDGLVGGIMLMILGVCGILTFGFGWYLATTLIGIVIGWIIAFLRFNIYPAQIFMGDAGALGLGGFLSTLFYLIGVKIGFFIPFLILFGLCLVELLSSFLQIFWKKVFHRKLFEIAPLHHLFERRGYAETSIVMKFWLVQAMLCMVAIILITIQKG